MPKAFAPKIVSANALLAGDVVYFDRLGCWTRHLAKAAVAETQEEADALLAEASAQQSRVVGPYLADVVLTDGVPWPRHFREAFREHGPSFRPGLERRPADSDSLAEDAALSGGGAW